MGAVESGAGKKRKKINKYVYLARCFDLRKKVEMEIVRLLYVKTCQRDNEVKYSFREICPSNILRPPSMKCDRA